MKIRRYFAIRNSIGRDKINEPHFLNLKTGKNTWDLCGINYIHSLCQKSLRLSKASRVGNISFAFVLSNV